MRIAAATMGHAYRQGVVGRVPARLQYPVTWAFAGLVILDSLFRMLTAPASPTPWVVVLGVLPALPCLYGAWRA